MHGEEREEFRSWKRSEPRRALPYYGPEGEEEEAGFRFPFDPWRLVGAAKRNLNWILTGAAALALMGLLLGMLLIDYKVSVPLLRKQTPNAFQAEGTTQFGPREYTDQTLFAFMRSGDLLHRVAMRAATNALLVPLGITPGDLAGAVEVRPSPNPDVVFVGLAAFDDLDRMVALANLYAEEVVDYTREIQRREAESLTRYLQGKLAEAEAAVQAATLELRTNFSATGFGDFDAETEADLKRLQTLREQLLEKQIERDSLVERISAREEHLKEAGPSNTRLIQAREELRVMLTRMTERHPAVEQKRAEIAARNRWRQLEASNRLAAAGLWWTSVGTRDFAHAAYPNVPCRNRLRDHDQPGQRCELFENGARSRTPQGTRRLRRKSHDGRRCRRHTALVPQQRDMADGCGRSRLDERIQFPEFRDSMVDRQADLLPCRKRS